MRRNVVLLSSPRLSETAQKRHRGKNEFTFSAYSDSGSGFDGNDTITDFKPNDVLQIVGGYRFEKLQMKNTSEGGVKGVKIIYSSNGASIFLQGFTQENLKPETFRIFEGVTD